MREFAVQIKAKVKARNLDSAQARLVALEKAIKGKVDWQEIHLKAERNG